MTLRGCVTGMLLGLACAAWTGCGPREHIAPTTGRIYHQTFALQAQPPDASAPLPAPLGAAEGLKIRATYLDGFAGVKGTGTVVGGGANPAFDFSALGGGAPGEKSISLSGE